MAHYSCYPPSLPVINSSPLCLPLLNGPTLHTPYPALYSVTIPLSQSRHHWRFVILIGSPISNAVLCCSASPPYSECDQYPPSHYHSCHHCLLRFRSLRMSASPIPLGVVGLEEEADQLMYWLE